MYDRGGMCARWRHVRQMLAVTSLPLRHWAGGGAEMRCDWCEWLRVDEVVQLEGYGSVFQVANGCLLLKGLLLFYIPKVLAGQPLHTVFPNLSLYLKRFSQLKTVWYWPPSDRSMPLFCMPQHSLCSCCPSNHTWGRCFLTCPGGNFYTRPFGFC